MRIGIDLGGTKIEGIVLGDDGSERARMRIPTPRDCYEATVEAVAGVVRDLEAKVGTRCRVGIGHPGAISPATGLIKNANSTRLNGQPLDVDLKRGDKPRRGAALQRRQLLRRLRSGRRCRRWRSDRVWCHPRHRRGRWRRDRRPAVGRRTGDRRRMGPQHPSLASRRRTAGASLLLRPPQLRRGVAERACLPVPIRAHRRPRAERHRHCRSGHAG